MQPFRLLDLPPELRNRIYEHTLEDQAPHELDVFTYRTHVPEPAITAVSRQLRKETIGLLQEATRHFWDSHIFLVYLKFANPRFGSAASLSVEVRSTLDKSAMPTFAPRLRNLTLKIVIRRTSTVEVAMVGQRCVIATSPEVSGWPNYGETTVGVAKNESILLYDACNPEYLDVYNILRVVCIQQGVQQPPAHIWNLRP